MQRIMLVGDIHLRAKRLVDISEAWGRAVNWAKDNDACVIAQAGDVFDHYNVYGREASTGSVFEALLSPYSGLPNPPRLISVIGNHDMGGPSDADALVPIGKLDWATIIRKPQVIEVASGVSICCLPWINRAHALARLIKNGMTAKAAATRVTDALSAIMGKLAALVKEHKKKGNIVVFMGHMEVTGAKLNGGITQANGSFEFSGSELASLGCDAYALGHIHTRQPIPGLVRANDGYLGTLCQLNFGEEGNSVGWRVIDVHGGQITRDEWVENDGSPRYFTVGSLDEFKKHSENDYIKLRCLTKPESLPDNVIFEKIPVVMASKRRLDEKLDADTPIAKLLSIWVEQQSEDVRATLPPLNDLVEAAENLKASTEVPPDAVGSLERLDRISLRHIASHKNTDVDLGDVGGICGIEGPTGIGKTTLMEALMLGLYGGTPLKPNLTTWVEQGYVGDAMVEVEFQSGGRVYVVRRELKKTTKTFTHKAYLFDTGLSKAIAGPKVEDVYSKCCELVGEPEMVWAGTFSSQMESGNIMHVEPSERKILFAKLLGTEKLLFISEAAKKLAQADSAVLDANVRTVADLKATIANKPEIAESLKSANQRLKEAEALVVAEGEKLEKATSSLAIVDAKKKERDEALRRQSDLTKRKADIQTRGKALKQQKETLEGIDPEAAKSDMDAARDAKAKIDEQRLAGVTARAEVDGMRKKAVNARAMAGQKQAERGAAFSAELTAYNTVVAVNEAGVSSAKQNLEAIKRRIKLLSGFPDDKACAACPLARDGVMARAELKSAEKAVETAQANLTELQRKAPKIEKWQPDAAAEIMELLEAADTMDEAAQKAESEIRGEDPELAKKAQLLPWLEARFNTAKDAKAKAMAIEAQLAELRGSFRDADLELKGIEIPPEPDDSEMRAAVQALQKSMGLLRDKAAEASRDIGKYEATLDSYNRKEEELKKIEGEMGLLGERVAIFGTLAKAFGRDDIPQFIVDGAIPRFEEVMAGLLREFDSRWSIQINSQKTTKKGTVQEVIDILVDDGGGARELFTYSGGEMKILKGIIRLAFATLQAERTGKGLKVMILDEATDMMDGEVSQTFVKTMSRASTAFKQVFIISHSDHVLSSISNRIVLSKGLEGPTIVRAIS